jgi:hypothetical protein
MKKTIKSPFRIICRRSAKIQFRREPPVQDEDDVLCRVKDLGQCPKVIMAIDMPIYVFDEPLVRINQDNVYLPLHSTALSLLCETFEAVTFVNFSTDPISLLLGRIVVTI